MSKDYKRMDLIGKQRDSQTQDTEVGWFRCYPGEREYRKYLAELLREFRLSPNLEKVLKSGKGSLFEAAAIGLESSDVETRAAITNLIEGDVLVECLHLLKEHKEDVSWLAEYMAQVVEYLEDE